ncbi:MAG: hypothetical protein EOP55_16375 [Sphingobacteriales bacterium]|nr:MAG: hypothetical protein EOP55_16375 [Sphingobacteriales bacterium]
MKLIIFWILITLGILQGCNKDSEEQARQIAKSLTTENEEKIVRSVIDALQRSDSKQLKLLFSTRINSETDPKLFQIVSSYFQHGTVVTAVPIGHHEQNFHSGSNEGRKSVVLTYEVKFSDGYFIYMVVTLDALNQEDLKVETLNVEDGQAVLARTHFSFQNRPALNYLFLLLMFVVLSIVIYAAYLCFKIQKKNKWFWILFILLPIGVCRLDWMSSEITYSPLVIQFLGISFLHNSLQPAFFSIAFPLGAIIFILKWKFGKVADYRG